MSDFRDCKHCKHLKAGECSRWDCEYEPKVDYISRQDAIDCVGWGDSITKVIDRIKSLPSADRPTGEWIPVSERLPEIHDEVLITAHGEVSIAWLYLDGEWRSNDMPRQMFKDIIAWMPLPKPYKGGEDE